MARRQPYQHVTEPSVPSASDEPDGKLWLSDAIPPSQEQPLEVSLADDTPEPKSGKEEPEVVAQTPEPEIEPKPEMAVQQKPSADDEAYNRLKRQLDRERQARESDRERLRQLESDRTSYQERLQQERERAHAMQREQLDSQELALDNAIAYAESQAASAQREITRALSEGDYDASANAYRVLAKAESDLSRLRDGKTSIEQQKKAPAPQREEPQQLQHDTSLYGRIEAYITQPGHSPRVQDFLREHYDDLFSDFDSGANRLSRLLGGHYIAKSDGVIEGSDAYFDSLSRHMGYTKADPEPQPESARAAPPPAKPAKHVPPAAPVSRGGQNGSGNSPTSVTLTPAMVEFCKASGINPTDYARNLLRAKEGGKDPSYSGPRFSSDQL